MDLDGLCLFDGNFHFRDFLSTLNNFEGEDSGVEFGGSFGFDFDHVEVPLLGFGEVVEEFDIEGELLEGGGEDGVLAEVDSGFVDLQALLGGSHHEAGTRWHRLVFLRLFLRWLHIQKYNPDFD